MCDSVDGEDDAPGMIMTYLEYLAQKYRSIEHLKPAHVIKAQVGWLLFISKAI